MTAEARSLTGLGTEGIQKQAAKVYEFLSHIFACLGIGVACALSAASNPAIPIPLPALLIPASALLWFRTANRNMTTLQVIVGTYLCAIPINLIGNRSVEIALFNHRAGVSYSLIVLGMLALGQLAHAAGSNPQRSSTATLGVPLWAWGFAGGVVLLHMLFQSWGLHVCYGYGYEKNARVLGWMSYFCLTWLLLRGALAATTWRRILCVVLLIYYAVMAAGIT